MVDKNSGQVYIVYISELVLFIYFGWDVVVCKGGMLSDVVLIILYLIGMEQLKEMIGKIIMMFKL